MPAKITELNPVILQIALPVPGNGLLDYLPASPEQVSHLKPGIRVRVPYGHRTLTGIFINTTTKSDYPFEKLKPVIKILDEVAVVSCSVLRLCEQIAAYYHQTIGEVLSLALPKLLRKDRLYQKDLQRFWHLKQADALDMIRVNATKQRDAIKCITLEGGSVSEQKLKVHGISKATLGSLETNGFIYHADEMVEPELFYQQTLVIREQSEHLNSEQQQAVNIITGKLNEFSATLLHGITGSGKTEVYLQVIEKILNNKKQALVLVPEIGLTPQTVKRFEKRFTVPVVVLHSGLNDTKRYMGWKKAHQLVAGIVISTRSGIFTSMPNLGLIVVDEEHDDSYKQQDGIRYSARDLALLRAKQCNIPVILGSATPSLESLNNALSGKYTYQMLTKRAGSASLPTLKLVDIRNKELHAGLCKSVINTIGQTLSQKQQVLLFINRRGFAPSLICAQCGTVIDCPNCDAHMTLHRLPPHMHCHHCDYQHATPTFCLSCNNTELIATGTGTERTEMALQTLFPDTPVLRIDRDSTRKKESLNIMLAKINDGKPLILVGTQMLAKGHHFPYVTLVVIVNIDAGFFSADFRGEEKTAQLLLQVSGRAGRSRLPGQALIQTYNPDHPDLQTLIHGGYSTFANSLLGRRAQENLPPFTYLALLTVESIDYQVLQDALNQAAFWAKGFIEKLDQKAQETINTIGPMPAPMEKRQNRFRGHLIFRSVRRSSLHLLIHNIKRQLHCLPKKKQCRWSVDIDPVEMC